QETEQLEFKYPGSPDGSLTESIVTATCKAICAMANSGGGYVFIGITQDNRISGVRLTYNNRPRELDEMQRLILPQHCRFQPDVPVDCMWPIQIAPDRYVFAFYISRKTRQVWEYNGKRYVRRGTQSIVR
ncbi:MAG: ATP-binding protein, partial [Anaerolineae bacterium]|nr:ATP-binding protein [Thermoflexales bacterium]MDW8407142.1 ATP-binding protein [Anaerolineae bacterium]